MHDISDDNLFAGEKSYQESAKPNLIRPIDLIAKLGIAGLNEAADAYYRRLGDLAILQRKPFTGLHETPTLLYHLGLLLGGLHANAGMDVMDFGCGTGWLGRIFRDLDCNVTFLDVSATAIKEAKRCARKAPRAGISPFPRTCKYLVFDGIKIDLPDSCLDRIVSFSTFHRTANPDHLLAEFLRVLRPGGVVAFYEPGKGHSESGASQREMREFNALENDINIAELCSNARQVGFSRSEFHLTANPAITIAEDQFISFHDGGPLPEDFVHALRQHTRSSYIFFFRKGDACLDSRQHLGLSADIHLVSQASPSETSLERDFLLRIRNTGTATWLGSTPTGIGMVRVGAHLSESDGTYFDNDFARLPLAQDVAPGETIEVLFPIKLPSGKQWEINFDLVAEGVAWFEWRGSKSLTVRLTVS